MKPAAIYCRYSTDRQDNASLEDQERKCRVFAASRGLTVGTVYTDAAVSGSTVQRAQLQKLLSDTKALKLTTVLVDDYSRLSRDLGDSINLCRAFEAKGVSIIDVETGSDSQDESSEELRFIKGFVGASQLKTIRRQTHRGLEGRALAGHATGGKTYGYVTIESNTADRRQAVIEPIEAELVRRIFTLTADGASTRRIADLLNTEGISAPHDGGKGHKGARGWGHTTIRAMLTNRRYIGDVTWNAFKWKRNHETGKRRRIARPESDHIVKHYPDLAIVPRELWDRVQALQPKKRASAGGSRTRAAYPLSGLLVCDACGSSFGAVSRTKENGAIYRNLGCVTHKSRGASICPMGNTLSERKVMTALVAYLQEHLSTPKRIQTFTAAFRKRFADQTDEDTDRTLRTNLVARQEALVGNILKALISVPGSAALGAELAKEEATLARLRADLESLVPKPPKVMPHPSAIATYVQDLQRLIAENPLDAAIALKRALKPFRVCRNSDGTWTLNGALGLCDSKSSGGVLHADSQSWLPLRIAA